jgi:hypothetical protein
MPAPQKSIQLTPAGWAALLLSVGVALGMRIVLPLVHPEQFAPVGRNDPRQGALAILFILVPVVFAGLAILLQFFGRPVFRLSEPPAPGPDPNPERDRPESGRTEPRDSTPGPG